uniref:Uncharacterized protein n=1 Tax=Kalanchoe fedtschenkoi TaxID=63787 RepID=A0A7N0U913_KALFE
MSLVTEEIRSTAEVHHGSEVCQERSRFLLGEMGLPSGLLPLKEVEECGYVPETGFVWLKQKKRTVHKFEKIGKLVSYETEVTAYVEKNRMRKLTGVKSKEILIWVSLTDFSLDPATRKITFKSPAGLYRSFPASAFEEEDVNARDKEAEVEGKNAEVQEEAERESSCDCIHVCTFVFHHLTQQQAMAPFLRSHTKERESSDK